jgi:hypothetical protein
MSVFSLMARKAWAAARCEAGVAFIEFAICIPLLILLLLGAVEMPRYVLVVQKVEKTINSVTDVLTESGGTVSAATISDYLNAVPKLMSPYGFTTNGVVILSGVSTPAGSPNPATINWQVCGGGTLSERSKIGTVGSQAQNLPNGFTMIANEQIVVGEIFYNFTPIILQNIVPPITIYRAVVFMPRVGTLNVTSSGC